MKFSRQNLKQDDFFKISDFPTMCMYIQQQCDELDFGKKHICAKNGSG